MANSALHAIAIAELRHSDPKFHEEYCKLVSGISTQIRKLSNQHPEDLDYTSFTETYDRASNEPVLQIAIGSQKNELYLHVYIHKENHFVIGKSGSGVMAMNAQEALILIAQKIQEIET